MVPKVRFKGFTDEWEQRELGEVSEKITQKNKDNLYSVTLTNSAEYGIIDQRSFFDKDISNAKNLSNYYVVHPDDFVYNPRISNEAPVGPIKRNNLDITGVMSPLYYVFRPHDINKTFLEYYFSTSKWHKFMKLNGNSGARSDRFSIKDSEFVKMPIPSPKNEEQVKIGKLLSTVATYLALQQRKLDQLNTLKKGLLQKMFADKKHLQPQLRFKGYADDWKWKKLGELANIKTGSRNHQDSIENGKYPFYVRSEKIEHLNEYDYDTEAILVPGDGKIGEIFHYINGKFALHQRVYKLDEFNGIDAHFLLCLLKQNFKKHALRLNAQGTVPSLRLPMFTKWEILIPSISEQEQIGKNFIILNNMILAQQSKLDKLNSLKKSLLQSMFI